MEDKEISFKRTLMEKKSTSTPTKGRTRGWKGILRFPRPHICTTLFILRLLCFCLATNTNVSTANILTFFRMFCFKCSALSCRSSFFFLLFSPLCDFFFFVFLKGKQGSRLTKQSTLSLRYKQFFQVLLYVVQRRTPRGSHIVVSREKKENKGAETTQQPVSLDSSFHFISCYSFARFFWKL